MKYLSLILCCITIFICQNTYAQQTDKRFEIEADPIAFLLSGYSFHLGYRSGHLRFDSGVYGIKQPSFFLNNDNFSVYSSGIGVKMDYFPKENRGLFFGLQSDYVTDKIKLRSTESAERLNSVTVGLRSGYRFMFGSRASDHKKFYLVPWAALIYSPNASQAHLDGETYQQSAWSIFPTVHLGYRF